MLELGITPGQITQFFGANPIASWASGMMSVLIVLGVWVRLRERADRSVSLDKSVDAHIDRLSKQLAAANTRIDSLSIRIDDLQAQRSNLVERLASAEASLASTGQRIASLELENQRLRDQNANQELALQHCDKEARAAQVMIVTLQQRVRELEARQDEAESHPNHDARQAGHP